MESVPSWAVTKVSDPGLAAECDEALVLTTPDEHDLPIRPPDSDREADGGARSTREAAA
jgi:hypothetical protein